MTRNTDAGEGIRSVDRALELIEWLQAEEGGRISEIAADFDVAPSTVHRHLSTLQRHGYVTQDGDVYHVGLQLLDPAIHAKNRRDAYRVVGPKVADLAEATGERAQFIAEENGRGVHVHSEVGKRGIQSESRVGKTVYLHATSAGKCVLANLPEERVDEIVDRHGLPALTENTITDRAELAEELETVREQGYAHNLEERRPGMHAVGAPIFAPHGEVLGGLSVTGPKSRMSADYEVGAWNALRQVREFAEDIMLRLEYPQL